MGAEGSGLAEVAYLASGCFWCTEAVFAELAGVLAAESGYMGGQTEAPTYDEVCSELTGHAEMVRVTYDPAAVSFENLLEVFFAVHDPTTLNRQGADVGTQYRSAIFAADEEQARVAREVMARLDASGEFRAPIVTEVTAAGRFWPAEPYHDDYFKRNPWSGYCEMVIAPKVSKFRKQFAARLAVDGS